MMTTEPRLSAVNPATLEILKEIDAATPADVVAAVRAARRDLPAWECAGLPERVRRLRVLRDRIVDRAEEIAVTVTKNTGKPRIEAYSGEIFPVTYLIDHFAKRGPAMLRPEKIALPVMKWGGRASRVEYKPVGVVGIISPWNYPFSIPMGDLVLALLAGCTVVLKPSELSPLVGELIGSLCREAELPVRIVQGDGKTGAALVEARPDKLVFTGGTATGRRIMEAASKHLIPVVLELGGKDPMIVLPDANLENASSAAVWGCFTNAGQVCASVKRVYVHEQIADAFIEKILAKTKTLRMGDPMDPETDLGCMISVAQMEKVERQVREAVSEGAKLCAGGRRRPDLGPCFFEPAIFTGVAPEMKVAREEIFGPVLPILRVRDENQAVELANDSPFGLCASVFSRSRGEALAPRLRAGTVTVNDCTYTHAACETPWGGVGESGFGRTHGRLGLHEFVVPFHVNVNRKLDHPSAWWYPYDAQGLDLFRAGVRFAGTPAKIRSLREMLKHGLLKRIKKRT